MKSVFNLLNEDRLDEIQFAFEAKREIRDTKYRIDRLEEKLNDFFEQNPGLKKIYTELEEEDTFLTARTADYFYIAGFKDGLKFLINDSEGGF
jgi:hypothetical protein